MTAREFLCIGPTERRPSCWTWTVGPQVLTRAGAMQGGALLAGAIVALEEVARRPLAWATGQYLRHVGEGVRVDVEVTLDVVGHLMTQAHAVVSAADDVLAHVLGGLGERGFSTSGTWIERPAVPPPGECEPAVDGAGMARQDVWELLTASGRSLVDLDGLAGPGRSASWCRIPGGARAVEAADLAIAGDYLMTHFASALGRPCTGNSLDNTVRVGMPDETEWILIDAEVHAVTRGIGHGTAHMWSEGGTFLGTASQTLVLRDVGADGLSSRSNRRIVGSPSDT
jgi:acyl-CoA thioesterase